MDIDDEEPPLLVESGEQRDGTEQITTDTQDLKLVKVPITIITGKCADLTTSSREVGVVMVCSDMIVQATWVREKPH